MVSVNLPELPLYNFRVRRWPVGTVFGLRGHTGGQGQVFPCRGEDGLLVFPTRQEPSHLGPCELSCEPRGADSDSAPVSG